MITINNVWKRYRGGSENPWVLKNLSFTIPKFTSVGLIGENGAGKSTLLRIIGGIDKPDKGSVDRNCSVSWPIGLSGGFQKTMTGRQNVSFVARIYGKQALKAEVFEKVQTFAEIGEAFDRPVRTYSSGMRARLAFGMSLAFDFDVYLSDEATAVGDAKFKKKAEAAFKEKVGEKSLIMVSHQEKILKELCQAGVLVHQGTAYWFDDIEMALREYRSL